VVQKNGERCRRTRAKVNLRGVIKVSKSLQVFETKDQRRTKMLSWKRQERIQCWKTKNCGVDRGIVKWMTKFICENKSELETHR
jgi:hypothetical protein